MTRVDSTCDSISSKERLWTGIAVGSAFLAGASGIAMFPAANRTQEQILAAGTIVAGGGAVVGTVQQQSYAREWLRSECDR